MRPGLVAVAHGTLYPDGPRTVERLMRAVKGRLPNVEVTTSYLDLADPSLKEVLGGCTMPVIVVPLLLSTGHHLAQDIPEAARLSRNPVVLAQSLGPDPMLAGAMGMRLRAAGANHRDAVVMVAAGSNDPDALVDTQAAGRMLEAQWGAPVKVAHLTGTGRRIPEVMDAMRHAGHHRIAIAPYVLAPGHVASQAQAQGRANGACVVSDVLGNHPMVVELVRRRYLVAERRWSTVRRTTRVA